MQHRIMRNAIALLAAIVLGGLVVLLVQSISLALYPPPADLDWQDADQVNDFISGLPTGAFLIVLLSHLGGALVAGWTCGLIVRRKWLGGAIALGVFFTLAGISNLLAIPHPTWFAIVDTVGYLPCAVLGLTVGARMTSKVEG